MKTHIQQVGKYSLHVAAPCTCRFHFREKGANLLPFHDVCDDMAGDLGMCAVGNDDRRPTLERPKSCFHLSQTRRWSQCQLLLIQPTMLIFSYRPADLGLHATKADSGLGAIRDGLLVSGIEYINELGIICSWRTVIQTCGTDFFYPSHKKK